MFHKGIIHVHSRYSYDSVTSIATLLDMALANRLDFVLVADHDTLEGARALAALAQRAGAQMQVPLTAEYRTDHGDVIAAFLQKDILTRSFREFVTEVRVQGGLLLLPHPYEGHTEVEWMAEQVDLIEVFNARIANSLNERALALAQRLRKPVYYASDAHLARNLTTVVLSVEGDSELKHALLTGRVWADRMRSVGPLDVGLSQCIKAWKRRDIELAGYIVTHVIRKIWRTATKVIRAKTR